VELRGARVLLTGATGGIGAAIARALHARGAQLILSGRRFDVLDSLAAELGAAVLSADLADRDAVSALIKRAGDVDVLVANAALPAVGRLLDFTEEELDRALDVNLRAPVLLARACTEQMLARGRGHVVLVGSLSGKTASPGSSIYNATKFALRGFALAHREDLHGTGVGVSIVEPGFVAEAGMFVDSGMQLPRGVRLTTPVKVAEGVVRSIEHNRGEVVVAPVELRLATAVGALAPALSAAVQRRAGAAGIAASHTGSETKR
jgi:short-subunit dehydrogenase